MDNITDASEDHKVSRFVEISNDKLQTVIKTSIIVCGFESIQKYFLLLLLFSFSQSSF